MELDVEEVEDLGHQLGVGVVEPGLGLFGEGSELALRDMSCFLVLVDLIEPRFQCLPLVGDLVQSSIQEVEFVLVG